MSGDCGFLSATHDHTGFGEVESPQNLRQLVAHDGKIHAPVGNVFQGIFRYGDTASDVTVAYLRHDGALNWFHFQFA